MDVWPCACARNPRTHVRAQEERPSLASLARVLPIPSKSPPQERNQHNQVKRALARFARSGAPHSLRCPSRHSLASLARCHSAPPTLRTARLGASFGCTPNRLCSISGALRFKRLQAAIQPPAHCLSATAL